MTEIFETDTVVIGAGIIGLAVAARQAQKGQDVILLESGHAIGDGVSGRNSGVLHAGIYYPANSLKAKLCVRGLNLLYDYCKTAAVPFNACGKWIVATSDEEAATLSAIRDKAAANGTVPLEWLTRDAIREQEPELKIREALFSPATGIVDAPALMTSLLGQVEDRGGMLALDAPVLSLTPEGSGFQINVGGSHPARIKAMRVINAAGLGAIPLAEKLDWYPSTLVPAPLLAKGNYFKLSGKAPFSHLIYPVPEKGGLGVHATLDMGGQIRFGPDVEWLPEGCNPHEHLKVSEDRKLHFVESVSRYWPGVTADRLDPDYVGIRPKIKPPEGQDSADFVIQAETEHGFKGLVQLFGIESPGLTSCLALAEHVSDFLD
ncbi:NAD(P)/FAD-dependent oxidoreductase [Kiloniella sp. b19]|uniref:NAD(P)/FAD-dependent oxidoreductase n=1 Tax=Kiloniella sp. GXU_MW_B19 TaxID=3141326 RepID=UPI0031D39DFF